MRARDLQIIGFLPTIMGSKPFTLKVSQRLKEKQS